jgi:hypothetical protein
MRVCAICSHRPAGGDRLTQIGRPLSCESLRPGSNPAGNSWGEQAPVSSLDIGFLRRSSTLTSNVRRNFLHLPSAGNVISVFYHYFGAPMTWHEICGIVYHQAAVDESEQNVESQTLRPTYPSLRAWFP